jgi:urease accessory protein
MLRVVRVIRSSDGNAARRVDSVVLGAAERRIQTGQLTGVNGTAIAFMLPEPVLLRTDDALELDDGSLVDVVIEPESLIEVRGNDLTHLARLAWHLGDRHVPVQVLNNRLRLRRDAALETMLAALGARITAIEAPFDPEGGAYATAAHDHDHGHHDHGDHDHHHGDAHGHSHHHGHAHHHGHHDHEQ